MDDFAKTIIGMLGAAVVAMWGFVVWLYRSTIARADKRIDTLENREDTTISGVVSSLGTVQTTMTTMVDAFRELRLALEKLRDEQRQGGR